MFLGHFAAGFLGKRIAPKASLGTYFLAAQFLDLLWPTFILLSWETVSISPGITAVTPLNFTFYPYSHSLVAAATWAVLFLLLFYFLQKKPMESVALGFVVLSHWVLDFISHRPDLPLHLHSQNHLGLGLWFSIPWTLVTELTLFAWGAFLYANKNKPRNQMGNISFISFVIFLLMAYFAAVFGPPPPNALILGWGGQSVWILVLWGYWIDSTRLPQPKGDHFL
jgi:hypothetical protein